MSATQITSEQQPSGTLHCKRCNAVLPKYATFCGNCGERVGQKTSEGTPHGRTTIAEQYRIISLVRRRPYSQIFRALDTQQRIVIIHDIDISALDEQARAQIMSTLQREYDLLRRQRLSDIIPLIDLRSSQEHLYSIAGWPFPTVGASGKATSTSPEQISTLEEILQSGIGLPDERIALSWVHRLANAVASLHKHGMVLEDIDPQIIFASGNGYEGQPALLVSWLPSPIRDLLSQALNNIDTAFFRAPGAYLGQPDPRSDVYSLGAILYLLCTGRAPAESAPHPPRELNTRIHPAVSSVIMQALSSTPAERFQSAEQFSQALQRLYLEAGTIHSAPGHANRQSKLTNKTKGPKEEIHISFASDDNKKEDSGEAQKLTEPDDVTVSIVPLQAQMARRYLSRIKTGKLGTQEHPTGEVLVEEGSNEKKSTGETIVAGKSKQPQLVKEGTDKKKQPVEEGPGKKKQPGKATVKGYSEETPPEDVLVDEAPAEPVQSAVDVPVEEGHAPEIADQDTVIVDKQLLTAVKEATLSIEEKPQAIDEVDVAPQDVAQPESIEPVPHSDSPLSSIAPAPAIQEQESGDHAQPQKNAEPPLQEPVRTASENKERGRTRLKGLLSGSLPSIARTQSATTQRTDEREASFLKRMQRFIIGEQQHSTTAAAIIETPMRIQPNQGYAIRITVTGRNEVKSKEAKGLGGMVEGDIVHIEVRSALYQNFAYIVQQADAQIPAEGFMAEITMPMQPLSTGPSGRRERLHIFFMDAQRHPLYEQPFVVELFISHLVQSGREGHNVLPIPL